jgi:hypothetical protein
LSRKRKNNKTLLGAVPQQRRPELFLKSITLALPCLALPEARGSLTSMERYGTRMNRVYTELDSDSCPTQISGECDTVDGETYADPLFFNRLCSDAVPPRNKAEEALPDTSWEPVREWLGTHSPEERREAAEQPGDSDMTALHLCCRKGAPFDVIDDILNVARSTAQLPDAFGWLPIHYACACGATSAVIKRLVEEFPESKTKVDRRGRTPLHFALGNPDHFATPDVVAILSSGGAVSIADKDGMLVSCWGVRNNVSIQCIF